ncbi:inner centromere protein isoform X1 [Takifugu flavidus]|uniref:inner centromere protein isoform X1 n=1 Tax=Takifugu flavidus TaxID=433684 RepID=UPI002544C1B5|nr:inner centromere protein isoform X1 [Takifugu flavidus]
MNPVLSSVQSMREMFVGKMQDFIDEIKNVHIVWLEEIQQEANRMFSRDFNTEPELMPKTPSQKKNSRRKRVSVGRHEENQTRRRFSKGRRSNLRGSSVKSLNFIAEEECVPEASKPKRTTRKKKQTMFEETEDVSQVPKTEETENEKPVGEQGKDEGEDNPDSAQPPPELPAPEVAPSASADQSLPDPPAPEVTVSISSTDRLSAENAKILVRSPGRTATKVAIAEVAQSSRRSSVQCSLKLRHSLAGLRHSMTQESVRRASRRSMLKRKVARATNSQCSSNNEEDAVEEEGEVTDTEDNAAEGSPATSKAEEPVDLPVRRVTRSVAANSPKLALPSLYSAEQKMSTPNRKSVDKAKSGRRSRQSTKRKAPDTAEESPTKRFSPPKKSQSAIRPNMRSFLHTVQKNQMLMMTPNTLGRTGVIKSFIKHTTPLRIDPKLSNGVVTKERYKLEALKKKQEQEEERMKKMEEEKKRKQEELKRKRDERLKRVFEAKVKEEQKEEEKKKKVEQKMAQIEVKNERLAEEKAKKKAAVKRQEELEKKKLEEEARKKKMEEEKRQLELLAKKKAEEEEHARKQAEARRALELRREQERERERQLERERERQLERERLAAAERERVEKEKALALQRELERAAREKERRELEEKRKALEERRKLEEQLRLATEQKAAKEREAAKQKEAAAKQNTTALNVTVDIERSVLSTPVGKGTGLNVTVDVEKSPQSYVITPKGGNKPVLSKTAEDYGMDQNSDDSTDDESAPRKPIPSWAENHNLNQIIMKQYFNPPDIDSFVGVIEPPKLEDIFYKSKPRYFKRTSSAVWHLPPTLSK